MTPYADGLAMLARRELSEAQMRTRLLKRGHPPEAVDTAIDELKTAGALNDVRVAEAIARMEVTLRRRGRLRVRRRIEQAGIHRGIADEVTERILGERDPEALIAAALERRLRPDAMIHTQTEFARLYRFLAGQGFESDRIMKVLTARRRS